jgi:hypothetical protein
MRQKKAVLIALRFYEECIKASGDPAPPEQLTIEEIEVLSGTVSADADPLIIVSGGIVRNDDVDVIDYDALTRDGTDEDRLQAWNELDDRGKNYVREHDPDIAAQFDSQQGEREFTFTVVEDCRYTVKAKGKTAAEAARNAGREFGGHPSRFGTTVEDRTAFISPTDQDASIMSDDVTVEFDQGVQDSYERPAGSTP